VGFWCVLFFKWVVFKKWVGLLKLFLTTTMILAHVT